VAAGDFEVSDDLVSLDTGSGLTRFGSLDSNLGFVSKRSSSSSALIPVALVSILRFFEAVTLAVEAFSLSRGAAGVVTFSDGPPFGCIPFAFISLSYRFALMMVVSKLRTCWYTQLTPPLCSLYHIPSLPRRSRSDAISCAKDIIAE
jgi:hypothetical protein